MRVDIIESRDALSGLRELPPESIDCIVTSPPYWQLRDYGLETVLWGGKEDCPHDFDKYGFCSVCGGWLGQLGQEPTREQFVANLLAIFDQCLRVLKTSGSCWVNLGDSYRKAGGRKNGIRLKSLCNIPGLFAEEMIRRGWILRNEIIWHKPSVIPASVRDRFTVDFEKMFFFTKSETYHFEQQFEPYAESTFGRYRRGYTLNGKNSVYKEKYGTPLGLKDINPKGRNMRTVWRLNTANSHLNHFASFPRKLVETPIKAGCPEGGIVLDPFMGSGTTAVVARELGRRYIGFEASGEYAAMARERIKNHFNDK